MQLVYLIGIFEDNHNNVRHHFETDSVNLINNRLLGTKKKEEGNFNAYQLGSVTLVNHGNCY